MAGRARAAMPPTPVNAVTLGSTGLPDTDRVMKQAEQAILDLQQQVRLLTARVTDLEARVTALE